MNSLGTKRGQEAAAGPGLCLGYAAKKEKNPNEERDARRKKKRTNEEKKVKNKESEEEGGTQDEDRDKDKEEFEKEEESKEREGEGKEASKEGEGKSKVVQWYDALWPLEALEDFECEKEEGGRADCLPQNAEDKPISPTRSAEAETVATAEAAVEADATALKGHIHAATPRAQNGMKTQ